MNPDTIRGYCDEIDALTQAIRDELVEAPDPDEVVITDGADLQAALSAGGPVALAPDLACHAGGGFRFDTPDTSLRGEANNVVSSDTAPALIVPVEMVGVGIESLEPIARSYSTALRLGNNDSAQSTLASAPHGIRLRLLASTGHRGKRVIEVNASDVEILDCDVHDCYDPGNQDSQAIWIGNAPGPVLVEGGYFEAASECLMVGGDQMKIPACRPTGITIRAAAFSKLLTWQVAGVKVKNLLELKDGHDVLIEDCDFSNCWKSAQDGYAWMFTPTRGGSLRNVIVRNCHVCDVGGIVNITGTHSDFPDEPRTQVTITGGEYRTNKTAMGGSGRFALLTSGPESFVVEDALVAHEGSSFIEVGDTRTVDLLRVVGSTWNYGSYGLRIGGYNHGDNAQGIVRELVITGNTISGAHSSFRTRYPDNTYVDAMDAVREHEVDSRAADHARDVIEEIKRMRHWDREYRL